jgi:hypothetical protein
LPEATERALWEKHKSKLAFPAGLAEAAERIERNLQALMDEETASAS